MAQKTIQERFETKISKQEDGCWIWQGYTQSSGYGQIKYNRKVFLSHRMSYMLYKGDVPKDLFVLHTCDVPRYVNPDHLFLGTLQENTRDAITKNRWTQYGYQKAKFTMDQVIALRARYKAGGCSQRQLADEYGVGRSTIRGIIKNRHYKQATCE